MKNSSINLSLKNLTSPSRISIPGTKRLYLWVRSDLKKYWIYRFTFQGIRHDHSLGSFDEVNLAM